MIEDERTAESYYQDSVWLPSFATFRDPFAKTAALASSLSRGAGAGLSPRIVEKDNSVTSSEENTSSASSTASSHLPAHPPSPFISSSSRLGVTPGSPSTSTLSKLYSSANATPSSSAQPSLRPSPLNSHRNSLETDESQIGSPHALPSSSRRGTHSTLNPMKTNRLCMQLKREHIVYEEATMGQLPEINIMKARLRDALPILTEGDDGDDLMSIRVIDSRPHYIIKGTILLESRKASWRKHSKLKDTSVEAQNRALPELSSIDPWELPVDGSSLVEGHEKGEAPTTKKTFEFPQYRTDAGCKKCTEGSIDCIRCGGLDAVECFWCASSGYFKGRECKKCNTTGRINCVKCNNTGKVACKTCEGKGAFKWALCVDVKMDSLSLPSITMEDLVDDEKEGEEEEKARLVRDPTFLQLKATQAIYETALNIFEASSDHQKKNSTLGKERRVPVLAQCHVERHMKRVLHVTRWNRFPPRHLEHSRFLYTTEGEEKLERLPFTMTEQERRRLEELDQREQQRLKRMQQTPAVPTSSSLPSMRSVPQAQPYIRNASLPHSSSAAPVINLNHHFNALSVQRGSM